jgi:predicted nucleic acid-binding protein
LNYLIDTNVISELFKRQPHPGVAQWMRQASADSLYLSVLTLGEMRKGVDAMEDGLRKMRILHFLDWEHKVRFEERILAVDVLVAEVWGGLESRSLRTLPTIDALLAATAMAHGMVLVTRNTKDFEIIGLNVLNPWTDGGNGPSDSFVVNEPKAHYRVPKKTGTKQRKLKK